MPRTSSHSTRVSKSQRCAVANRKQIVVTIGTMTMLDGKHREFTFELATRCAKLSHVRSKRFLEIIPIDLVAQTESQPVGTRFTVLRPGTWSVRGSVGVLATKREVGSG